jgi:hypothetical protein
MLFLRIWSRGEETRKSLRVGEENREKYYILFKGYAKRCIWWTG